MGIIRDEALDEGFAAIVALVESFEFRLASDIALFPIRKRTLSVSVGSLHFSELLLQMLHSVLLLFDDHRFFIVICFVSVIFI